MSVIERPKSLTERIRDELMTSIMDGTIPMGRLLSEKVLAAQFGTSKTPVREAFVSLQSLGLVEVLPQKGCLVFFPTITKVNELCEVRIVLETAAIRFAMANRRDEFLEALCRAHELAQVKSKTVPVSEYNKFDDRFHWVFFDYCNNDALRSAYELFWPRIQTLRINQESINTYLVDVSVSDHGGIVEKLQAGDIDEALEAIAKHIRRMSDTYASNWDELITARAATS